MNDMQGSARGAVRTALAVTLAALLLAGPTHASPFRDLGGHLSAGYGKLFTEDESPSGSLSVGAGLDVPLAAGFRAGIEIGFHLLGSRTVERGSLLASIDYTVLEAALLAHWSPRLGVLQRVSLGPALLAARGELSTAGAGVGFSDLAVEETAPGFAAAVTVGSSREAAVRLGVEVAVRQGYLEDDTWTIATLRGVVRY